VQLLKYTVDTKPELAEYKIGNLTPKQSTLIDALAEYGAKSAEKINALKHADHMRNFADISHEILAEMKIKNPEIFPQEKQKTRNAYGHDGR